MANQIRFKRASGSDPGASDLVLGEPAVRTDTGELFFKKDDGSVAKVSGGGISDGDKGDITVSNSGATFTIDSGVVTSTKIADDTIVNADINASAAIAGTKIDPDFGSQNIVTTGTLGSNILTISHTTPMLILNEGDGDPDYRIAVDAGRFRIQDTTNGNVSRLDINTDGHVDVTGHLDVGAGLDVTGAITGTGDLTIDTNTLHVDSSNNRVGIGTTSPNRHLHLHESDSTGAVVRFTNTTTGSGENDGLTVGINGSEQAEFWQRENTSMVFATNNTPRMTIDSSGNVGINTTTPLTEFYVFGGGTVATFEGTGGSSFISIKDSDDGTQAFIGVDAGKIKFQTSGSSFSDKLVIDTSGNVGIGTTSPSSKLDVNGTVTATAFAGDGSALTGISAGATGGGSDEIFYENDQTVTADYTITSGKNAMSAGPIIIDNGVSVTVPSGSTYTIV